MDATSQRLSEALTSLLHRSPELEAAAVVSFDGLPMASALPRADDAARFDEDRVAAMSAALLSLGERAAAGLGRGELSQVYVEGEHGSVFLVSAQDEAVLVAVGARDAKTGLVLFELKRTAAEVATALRLPGAAFAGSAAEAVLPAPVPVPADSFPYGAPTFGLAGEDAAAAQPSAVAPAPRSPEWVPEWQAAAPLHWATAPGAPGAPGAPVPPPVPAVPAPGIAAFGDQR